MKNLGFGKGVKHAHDYADKMSDMQCLPDSLVDRTYYKPTDQGFEQRIRQRLEDIRKIKARSSQT
jgi:putative ATPase